jgi:TIR domain
LQYTVNRQGPLAGEGIFIPSHNRNLKGAPYCDVIPSRELVKSAGALVAYTPCFKHDLFISYPTEAQGWAKQFHADLQADMWLAAAKIYFAPKSWELGEDSDGMLDAAGNSAVFVAVLTPDSVRENSSRFLRKEMDAFREASPLKRRFCPILLAPIDSAQLSRAMPTGNPDAFWNANLEFYYLEDGIPLRLEQNDERYKKAVQKAAYQLRKRLDEIQRGAGEGAASNAPFEGMTVYLAPNATYSSVEREWQDIRSLLRNDGVCVVPSARSEGDAATTGPESKAAEDAVLFIQVFSAHEVNHAKAQLETFETGKSGKPIDVLQWRKKFEENNIDWAVLKELKQEDREFCEGAQTGLLEHFKVEIRRNLGAKLAKIKAAQERPSAPPSPSDQPYIYIAADTPDLRLARQLQKTATERAVAVIMNEEETQRREDFESNLALASGVVFLHGNATRRFVELWLNEFVKKTRLLKLHPKIAALYEAPPEKTDDERPSPPIKLRIVGSQKEFTIAGIEKICAELCDDRA